MATNKLIWKTEAEQQAELDKEIQNYKQGKSKDGMIVSAEGKFIYRGISYLVKVLRYYNHTNRFVPLGSRRKDSFHAVVEYPEETREIAELIPKEFNGEFLYHDTLHSWNDNQPIEQQIEICHTLAKRDIDSLIDGNILVLIDNQLEEIITIKNKLLQIIKKIDKNERGEIKKWKKPKPK